MALRALDARQKLYDHVDAIWEGPKTADFHPADDTDTYGGVAALRDLAQQPAAARPKVQGEAGDDN